MRIQGQVGKMQARQGYRNLWHANLIGIITTDPPYFCLACLWYTCCAGYMPCSGRFGERRCPQLCLLTETQHKIELDKRDGKLGPLPVMAIPPMQQMSRTNQPVSPHAGYQHPHAGYPPPPTGYPNQPAGYPTPPAGCPNQPAGYPNQLAVYPNQHAGHPNQHAAYGHQPAGYMPAPPYGQPVYPPGPPPSMYPPPPESGEFYNPAPPPPPPGYTPESASASPHPPGFPPISPHEASPQSPPLSRTCADPPK